MKLACINIKNNVCIFRLMQFFPMQRNDKRTIDLVKMLFKGIMQQLLPLHIKMQMKSSQPFLGDKIPLHLSFKMLDRWEEGEDNGYIIWGQDFPLVLHLETIRVCGNEQLHHKGTHNMQEQVEKNVGRPY